ncbi:MAG: phosphoglycerate mutase (2,3-diphosphoglycerate-independent) [Candidatus Moranbacteria bacterium RIFOXYB1_FULL_44_23]|nr:MAG: 2,3-bisphosphoglycerate-independent phosphoglycerate mutase [Candidatus Moranbacteria bacterium GW2011_GWF2_44_10]OGI24541.1 MAG: phosphoglycerate mutase (2,3-diphosphoglycerate-independent) [Candidatus Moranbacteria bacterium RIFOXYA1_FULL_44_8]OGI36096.1 MAG: phosphoglycerate mutase (2,3-diphosphoglycerate-independent) [Candidatus Moranbacteria bacterium RIFOXYC1_FULL_44_8]OGI40436.1 MAG: phosphoglycerate mutase (2,3-diphosphoglycerate-independent) [Candidatus Moranbacteria bacterium R
MIRPVFLIVLDGWGENSSYEGNAIAQAKTPSIDKITRYYPETLLQASGISVGLPWGEMGNSEVGHLTLGAGRVIYQNLPRITLSVQDGTFFKNEALLAGIENVKKNGSALHFMGLASDGGVHSSLDHLYALVEMAKKNGLEKIFLHLFTDGRDAPPTSGLKVIGDIEARLAEYSCGKIASISGRYFAMDRNDNWNRIKKAYDLLTLGQGKKEKSALETIQKSYDSNVTDEFIEPTLIDDGKGEVGVVKENDTVIFFNFREDRARQLTKAFVLPTFTKIKREKYLSNLEFVCFTQYEDNLPVRVAFPPIAITNSLGEVVSRAGLHQLRIAETEKYAHVTYFFNGGQEEPFANEERILVPSQSISTYDKMPEMSAPAITETILKELGKGKYSFILVNFANPDMVGHTGNMQAAISAVETVDVCLGKIVPQVLKMGGSLFITADHGNAEELTNPRTEEPDTEHSIFPVPIWYVAPESQRQKSESEIMTGKKNVRGILGDVAPTVLSAMNLKIPPEMTGRSLLEILK